jgi:hypothetical protein
MRLITLATMIAATIACGGGSSSPTAPTPPPVAIVVPPPVVTPPPAVVFPPTDARFDLTFYRQLVHNGYETRGALEPLRRQRQAPRIYLRTVDDGGGVIDAVTLNQTAAALINTAGSLTGVFGLAGLERGTETRERVPGWITVRWSQFPKVINGNFSVCGEGFIGGDLLILYPRSSGCRCSGNPGTIDLSTIKHELGHVLGFWHTDSARDLMYPLHRSCDLDPSPREIYHASIAYTRPIGSAAP